MKCISLILSILLVFASLTCHASILEFKQFNIDFTNSADATAKATWSNPEQINVSKNGFGWDGDGSASRDGWIQTKSVALGTSWRPATAATFRVEIQPQVSEITLNNGQKFTPDSGDVYVRYSPDRMHWSSWQALQRAEPRSIQEKEKPGRYFQATIRVPYREQSEYSKLLSDYSKLDVPWKSDEEAAVKWILNLDSDFFSKQIPFIGYVEFLYEGSMHGGKRIQSFKANISYCIGGMHIPPKDESVYKERMSPSIPWRFEAKENVKTGPIAPAKEVLQSR